MLCLRYRTVAVGVRLKLTRAYVHQHAGRELRQMGYKNFPVAFKEPLNSRQRQAPHVVQCIPVVRVGPAELYLHVPLVVVMLARKVEGVGIVACLVEHVDGSVDVEVGPLPLVDLLDELVQLLHLLQLRVAIQQQRRVLLRRVLPVVDRVEPVQVRGQVHNPLGVQKPTDDVTRFCVADGLAVLLDGAVPVALLVLVVPVDAVDFGDHLVTELRVPGEEDGVGVVLHVKEHV
mmetsp:Transcript_125/g.154  ORF Transcript_125/g.154 Transcript_125/m.154 type:complete len:232 (-) Transcript_125:78-773(-)